MLLVLLGLTFIGYSYSKKFKQKLSFYKDLNNFCNVLENQIKFSKNTLTKIVVSNTQIYGADFNQMLTNYFTLHKPFENLLFLNERENAFIANFLNSLGKLDASGEVNNIKNYNSEVIRQLEGANDEYQKFGTMVTKLEIIAGLLICVLLI